VASLLPAATEIVAALGGLDLLVGISHECDYPPEVASLPRLTRTPIDAAAPGDEIDAQVRALFQSGRPVIAVDGAALQAARPTVILTQALCDVCAVGAGGVFPLGETSGVDAALVAMTGRTVAGVWADVLTIGESIGRSDEARALVDRLDARLRAISARATHPPKTVLVIEWLEPLFLAGHWVPELVMIAGGRPAGPEPGTHSVEWSWRDVTAMRPDLVVLALCGMNVDRALGEWRRFADRHPAEANALLESGAPLWALDGNAYTSRPGPRMVEVAEVVRGLLGGTADPRLVAVRPVRRRPAPVRRESSTARTPRRARPAASEPCRGDSGRG
jgi:iron complex transport system substrate-binding protein